MPKQKALRLPPIPTKVVGQFLSQVEVAITRTLEDFDKISKAMKSYSNEAYGLQHKLNSTKYPDAKSVMAVAEIDRVQEQLFNCVSNLIILSRILKTSFRAILEDRDDLFEILDDTDLRDLSDAFGNSEESA